MRGPNAISTVSPQSCDYNHKASRYGGMHEVVLSNHYLTAIKNAPKRTTYES